MLRLSRLRLALVTGGAVTHTAATLNSLLDISQGKQLVPRDELKSFLKTSVMPVLAGTELDRRGNSTELRRSLGQLTRDAAFAATVVGARPEAGFVRSITTCIKEDHQRMRFVSKMTSAQASKTIENLCKLGVKDEAVYPVLISRLDYGNLQELSRVTLALAESGLHELNMLVVVPLYCGDKWEVETNHSSSSSSSSTSGNAASRQKSGGSNLPLMHAPSGGVRSSNVFEAVRVLRALSKSCRQCVEVRRTAAPHTFAEVPRDSLNLLRNNLLKFVFENGQLLRGAHWVNVSRALMYFPVEFAELRQLAALCPAIEREVQAGVAARQGHSSSEGAPRSIPLTCDSVAEAAIAHVFDYAEHRREIPAEGTHEGNLSADFPFDLAYPDLVKLLPMLEHSASTKTGGSHRNGNPADSTESTTEKSQAETRVYLALRGICAHAPQLFLRDHVKVLQTLRRLPPSDAATAAVNVIVNQAAARLVELPPAEFLQKVSFTTIVQFAAALSALRVTRCDDFVTFVYTGASFFPRTLTADTTLAFANALANVATHRSAACHEAMRTLLARLVHNYEAELQTAPLVSTHPHAVTKILRACVLLDYIPESQVLQSLLGCPARPLQLTAEVHAAGGALAFGLTRSLAHFLKQARVDSPKRAADLWEQGVIGALFPLVMSCTKAASQQPNDASAAYTAVSWRSTLEMLTAFVDPSLSHNTPAETAQRLVRAFPLCRELLSHAAAMTQVQVSAVSRNAKSTADLRRRMQQISFNSNCSLHFLSSLLIFEYLINQCVSQMSSAKAVEVPEDLKQELVVLKETAFQEFLNAPCNTDLADTPMSVVHRIFECPVGKAEPPVTTILLSRRDALEITTNLPFALSLVMNPGPVNEYFTDRCMSLMVSDDGDEGDEGEGTV